MGKNAFVIEHHHGDDGTVSEGKILRDISQKRFDELEKKGLVREATAAEVEAGDQHAFEKDTSGDAGDEGDGEDQGEKQKAAPSNKQARTPANKGA